MQLRRRTPTGDGRRHRTNEAGGPNWEQQESNVPRFPRRKRKSPANPVRNPVQSAHDPVQAKTPAVSLPTLSYGKSSTPGPACRRR